MINNYFDIIENINRENIEMKNDKKYSQYLTIKRIFHFLFHFHFIKILKIVRDYFASIIVRKKYNSYIERIIKVNNNVDYKKSKIAIYTCIIGDYDEIYVPYVFFDNVDYYLFTDNPDKYSKFKKYYKIVNINDIDNIKNMNNSISKNRYIKIYPHSFFKKYDYSIYLDGNIQVVSDIRNFILYCNKKSGLAMHNHRERSCIYDEAKVCNILKRGNKKNIKKQIKEYEKEGFPKKYGMLEANVIVRDIKNENSKKILHDWWMDFYSKKSMRDQLSLPYILWKNDITINDIGIIENNVYKNYKIRIYNHK